VTAIHEKILAIKKMIGKKKKFFLMLRNFKEYEKVISHGFLNS